MARPIPDGQAVTYTAPDGQTASGTVLYSVTYRGRHGYAIAHPGGTHITWPGDDSVKADPHDEQGNRLTPAGHEEN